MMTVAAKRDLSGHKFSEFKRNGTIQVGQCALCLDYLVINDSGVQLSNQHPCDGNFSRINFSIGWTPDDEKRYAPIRAERADIRYNQTATGVQPVKRKT